MFFLLFVNYIVHFLSRHEGSNDCFNRIFAAVHGSGSARGANSPRFSVAQPPTFVRFQRFYPGSLTSSLTGGCHPPLSFIRRSLCWLGHRRFSPSLSALCVRTIRPSRPAYPRHTQPHIPLPVRPRKMPSRPLGLNAGVAHAASKDSSFSGKYDLPLCDGSGIGGLPLRPLRETTLSRKIAKKIAYIKKYL